jgi:DegV family protein with EDD domain
MTKVAIITDSTSTVPQPLVEALNIHVVPLLLHIDGRTYRDGIDLTPGEFYRLLRAEKPVPTTSGPSVGEYSRILADAASEAEAIVAIHLPPALSGVHNTAILASQRLDGVPVRVVDSRCTTMAQGFVVLEAARAAAAGADLEAVVARAVEVSAKVRFYAALQTLEYLHRGGRIGGAAALMGKALRICPIVYLVDGRVEPYASPRTRRKAIARMLRAMEQEVGDRPVHVAVMQGDALPEAEQLMERVSERFDCLELYLTEFTPVMGAHAGPGMLGLAYYVD